MIRALVPFALFAVLSSAASLGASQPPASSDKAKAEKARDDKAKDEIKTGSSVTPVVGYDPTFGVVAGGAYFYEEPKYSFGTVANWNFGSVFQVHVRFAHRFSDGWEYSIRSGNIKGFDPFYGDGGATVPSALVNLKGAFSRNRVQLTRRITELFSIGIFGELRLRTETSVPRFFPDETTGAVGLSVRLGTRSSLDDTRDGFALLTEFSWVPAAFTSADRQFGQIESSFVVNQGILRDLLPDVFAVFCLMGGISASDPTYMYKYRLGGAQRLRGYLENRFRGKKYYLNQTELRFGILKFLGAAGYWGFGDVTDDAFTNPKLAYGIGLRLGLPPDYVSKIRIDYAWGKDQQGFFVEFGQTF